MSDSEVKGQLNPFKVMTWIRLCCVITELSLKKCGDLINSILTAYHFGLISLFNGISMFMGYLMSKPSL